MMKSTAGKFVQLICGIGCLLSLAIIFWGYSGPLEPDPVHGLVVPQNVHGDIHYISHAKQHWVDIAWWTFPLCLFLIAFCQICFGKSKK
jgi:hypothetical protein